MQNFLNLDKLFLILLGVEYFSEKVSFCLLYKLGEGCISKFRILRKGQ